VACPSYASLYPLSFARLEGDVSEKVVCGAANHGFLVPVAVLPGTLRLWPWTECEKMASQALRGIFSCGRESKMEIPAEIGLWAAGKCASALGEMKGFLLKDLLPNWRK